MAESFLWMLRYIKTGVCSTSEAPPAICSSASFYYNLARCGGASNRRWCNAPNYP
jgi:hypothetical protein